MKISINWISDYVDLSGIETDELVKRFNLSTAEIEGVEYKGKEIENVVPSLRRIIKQSTFRVANYIF